MPPPSPRTFSDLAAAGLEIEVTCQRCGHRAVIDDTDPALRGRPIAGRRFRSRQCGAVGLPSLGTRQLRARLAERLDKLDRNRELPGRKVDPRR